MVMVHRCKMGGSAQRLACLPTLSIEPGRGRMHRGTLQPMCG